MRKCGSPDVVFPLQVIVDVSVEKLDGLYRHDMKISAHQVLFMEGWQNNASGD